MRLSLCYTSFLDANNLFFTLQAENAGLLYLLYIGMAKVLI